MSDWKDGLAIIGGIALFVVIVASIAYTVSMLPDATTRGACRVSGYAGAAKVDGNLVCYKYVEGKLFMALFDVAQIKFDIRI